MSSPILDPVNIPKEEVYIPPPPPPPPDPQEINVFKQEMENGEVP